MKLKTSWREFPPQLRRHLDDRLKDRDIREDDLYKLGFWLEGEPDVPGGDWYKDFGTFGIGSV